MDRFCSWGGGKDSCLARSRARRPDESLPLLTMVVSGGATDHRAYAEAVGLQADALRTSIHTETVTWSSYEDGFEAAASDLGADVGVFGTIDVEEHRSWVEATCAAVGVTPSFPLWGEDPVALAEEFIHSGWEAAIVKLDASEVEERWLGEPFDAAFLEYAIESGIHPMGEDGEYQTLVVDGPGFARRVPVEVRGSRATGTYRIAQLEVGGSRT